MRLALNPNIRTKLDRIDLIYKTLNNGTMKAPDSLLDYFEHAITCETCQVSLSIPNDKQDELVITSWVSKSEPVSLPE